MVLTGHGDDIFNRIVQTITIQMMRNVALYQWAVFFNPKVLRQFDPNIRLPCFDKVSGLPLLGYAGPNFSDVIFLLRMSLLKLGFYREMSAP